MTLDEIANLKPDWDSYGSPPPCVIAIAIARKLEAEAISMGMRTKPVPMPDGGVAITIEDQKKSAHIDAEEDGRIYTVLSDRKGYMDVQEVADDGIRAALERIREFLAMRGAKR